MLVKNLDGHELLTVLPARLVLDLAASLKFLISGSPRNAWAVLRGLVSSYLKFPVNREKRPKREDSYPNKKMTGICKKSVLIAYYLRGVRKFSQLGIQ